MTRIRRLVVGAAIGFVLPALVGVSPAFAARYSTATPSTDLVDGQTVHIDGAGFNGSVAVGFCQAIDDGTPGQADCGGATPATTTTSSAGTFSGDVVVRRLIFVPSAGRTVNCAARELRNRRRRNRREWRSDTGHGGVRTDRIRRPGSPTV